MLNQLKNNWKSGVSVALVSVPLSLSLAIAAGASPMTGIITAVWAGLVAGIIGGSNFNIVGPAGALAGILAGYSLTYSPAILPIVAMASGVIILLIWILRWDKYLIFVPSSVIHGFTLGVALTIAFGQMNAALGISGLPSHSTLVENILETLKHLSLVNWAAFIPFLLGLGLMFLVLKLKPLWPNSIIVAILGIVFGYASVHGYLPFHFQTVGSKYPGLSRNLFLFPQIGTLLSNNAFAALSRTAQIITVFKFSLVVAFVALLETLISAKTADGMTKTKFNQRRESLGVGLANIVSGFFGGLPASGVFARTALNVRSGATSNYSEIINAIAVGIISIVFISGFNYLPLSITASILVYAAIRMITAEHFKRLYKFDKTTFALALIVAALTFGFDATTGILAGTLASLLVFANKLAEADLGSESDPENFNPEEDREHAVVYRFAGAMTYFNSKSHIERLNNISGEKPVILNFRHLHYIDVDGYEALDEMMEDMEARNKNVFITGVRPEMVSHFAHHGWYEKLISEKRVVPNVNDALAQIG